MRTKTILVSLCGLFAGIGLCLAADVNLGTWKLNEAKSKIAPGMAKNTTVVYTVAGDSVKVTVDGVDKDGKPAHNEWTGKFDGKDYPIVGDPNGDTRSYAKVDDHTMDLTTKKGGKIVSTAHLVVAADGKSRTLNINATDPSGKKTDSMAVYDKQ